MNIREDLHDFMVFAGFAWASIIGALIIVFVPILIVWGIYSLIAGMIP